ncbi:hypothetical protein GBAR_LOCUS10111, partial [Geodia barretti]
MRRLRLDASIITDFEWGMAFSCKDELMHHVPVQWNLSIGTPPSVYETTIWDPISLAPLILTTVERPRGLSTYYGAEVVT